MKQKTILLTIFVLIGMVTIFAAGCIDNEPAPEATVDEVEDVVEQIDTDEVMETDITESTESMDASEYDPTIDVENFVEVIDNSYFPLIPGTTFIYEGENEDKETERNEVYVTHETRVVMGVTTTVVNDKVWEDGELIEETDDWYAQDADGNIWYFGEDSKEYEDGKYVGDEGSWEAGVNDAKPGIIMKMDPQVGDEYRQEYLKGEAEDMAEVISLTESITVEYGSFDNCLMTREWTPLEPGVAENKYYAKDVGQLKEIIVEGDSGYMELIEITTE
jgi:hypothetical protein